MDASDAAPQKAMLRAAMRAAMETLPRFGAEICAQLTSLPCYAAARTVFCFYGVGHEIDTLPFLQRVMADGKTLCLPRCEPGQPGVMTARRVTSLDALTQGSFGILEPQDTAPTMPPAEIDLAVLPCLAAEASGARLGQGGGYYDRFLPQLAPACTSVLLCRTSLVLPEGSILCEAHDVPVPVVLTECGLL